jgi:chitin synthase
LVQSATKDTAENAFSFMNFNGAGGIIFDVILKLYIAVLFVITICSLGNRPQGSKMTYGVAILLFGICNIIALWCAGYTVYMAVPHTLDGWSRFGDLIQTNATFRDIVISLAATYGLFLFSSFIHFEPWHMFTSFLREC